MSAIPPPRAKSAPRSIREGGRSVTLVVSVPHWCPPMFRRLALSASLFVVGFLAVATLSDRPTAFGQDKKGKNKDTKDEAQLRTQLKNAQQKLNAAEQKIAGLQAEIKQGTALVASLKADLRKGKSGDATDDKTITALSGQLNGIRGAKYVHTSTWKKKADASDGAVQALLDDVPAMLGKNKSVLSAWAGKPAATTDDYDVALVLVFDDVAAFETHKLDPQGKKFHDKHDKKFETPKAVEFTIK